MKFPSFWPIGGGPVEQVKRKHEPSVAEEARIKAIKTLQDDLRVNGATMTPMLRQDRLQALITLMEEDEVARGGDFDSSGLMHYLTDKEKDTLYSVGDHAANDSSLSHQSDSKLAA